MPANILRRELRLNRRGFLIWSGVIVLVMAIYLPFFPYMQDPEFTKLLETYPASIRDAFNLSGLVFQDVNHYYAGLIIQYLLALTSIYAGMLAGRLISREADLKTAEFLFTRPLTRSQVMAAKVAAFVLLSLLLWTALYTAAVLMGLAMEGAALSLSGQLPVHLAGLLATLATGGIAFAAAPFIDQAQTATSLGVGLGFGFFILDAASRLTDKLEFLRYLTTYYYAGFAEAVAGEPFLTGWLVLAAVFILGTGLGFVFLNRKQFAA